MDGCFYCSGIILNLVVLLVYIFYLELPRNSIGFNRWINSFCLGFALSDAATDFFNKCDISVYIALQSGSDMHFKEFPIK